jgi:predicted tellurium resistance membrane protein TerC
VNSPKPPLSSPESRTSSYAILVEITSLYFVLQSALSKLVYLNYGLALILALIGVKLMLHWAHGLWPAVPEIPTLISLAAIVLILAVVTMASTLAGHRTNRQLARRSRP